MKTFDKGTVIRTVLLLIAFINQTLVMFGQTVLPISEEQVQTAGEALYVAGSTIFTMVTAIIAWFKNNYVTEKGKKQKEILKQKGLSK
ncbi:phage holin [Bacillus pumilus]|uniref:phage holin n=1 Tax=Bacillus pumilus TaxID=1408 RepID=UPI00017A5DAC|nr:phage holin [Bacillus pumilus]EDW22344.1 holin, SPP1 family [Bacillus pumilus ATCC 7061]MBB6600697.1 phage holin [Bacillus pumilus]MCR4352065.1 phage holin [Bacillus pumilus]MCY7506399.1 phage holin [Bacillus pumilus]MDR4269217.1 phage holin [Bacillus pumilus]